MTMPPISNRVFGDAVSPPPFNPLVIMFTATIDVFVKHRDEIAAWLESLPPPRQDH